MSHQDRGELFEVALATVADAVIATDQHLKIVYLNPAAEAMSGWRLRESQGLALTEVLVLLERDTDRAMERPLGGIAESMGDDPAPREAALVNRRGMRMEIELSATALRDERGCFTGAVVVFRARRQAAEIALQNSNEYLLANADALFEEKERAQVTLNSIGDAVISTNFSGRVSYLNSVAEKMTGWTQCEATGNAVDDIFRIVDAATHESVPCPTVRAIIENRRVSLESVCVLDRRDGESVAVEVSAAPIHDRIGGVIGAVMVAQDVTASRELSQRLARLALHDSLTDLPNRALFSDRLGQAMARARAKGCHTALLYVDLDRFKHINDTLGHAIGDKLLQTVARRLLGCVRSSDTVSRQGGDEFVVLLAELPRIEDAAVCAEKILCAVQSPYRIGDHEVRVTASIGIAAFPDDAAEGDALIRCADHAMYQAKYNGRNNYKLFSPGSVLDPIE